jgi:hypothetical protein
MVCCSPHTALSFSLSSQRYHRSVDIHNHVKRPRKTRRSQHLTPTRQQSQHHHHHLNARARLRHFLHPSGTRVHIADSPIEADQLHRRLSNNNQSSALEPFSVYISGSPEHLSAVQETQSHHQDRRAKLRNAHGEVWDQFAEVQSELNLLSRELGRVTEKGGLYWRGILGDLGIRLLSRVTTMVERTVHSMKLMGMVRRRL